jgi:hypothetical protein
MTINKYVNIYRSFVQALFFETGQEKIIERRAVDIEKNENANRMPVINNDVCGIWCKHWFEGQNLRSEFIYIIGTIHSSVLTLSCCRYA